MTRPSTPLLAVLAATAVLAMSTLTAYASSETWYVIPEDQGDCGDECYTPPTAWIDDSTQKYAFGITCENTMILGGPASYVSEVTIGYLDMAVDGEPQGRFNVDSGLNDIFITPQDGASGAPKPLIDALRAGQALKVTFKDGQSFNFSLSGSGNALTLMTRLCAG